MNRYILLLFCLFFGFQIQAQDKHFTQFYAAPLTANPGLTGAFDGKYRLGLIRRSQWAGALDNPYNTFATSIQVKFGLDRFLKSQYKDKVAFGLMFYSDKVKQINFNTTSMALSAAYHKALDANSKQYLSVGFQGLLTQRNVTYDNYTFDDQFDGLTGYIFDTGEDLPSNNFSFTDFSVGLNYSVAPTRNLAFFLGGAIHHVGQPEISFYNIEDEPDSPSEKLYQRYTGHLSANIKFNNQLMMVPRAMVQLQGPHTEINAGTNFRISISEYSGTALNIGGWVRPVGNSDNGFGIDAVAVLFGLEHNGILLGLSYDINPSDLATYQQGQNSFELSIAYIGEYESESILCPKF